MGQTNARMDRFKLHDLGKKSHLMLIDVFLSIALHGGRKFSKSPAKCCLLRLIELQPGECLF